VLFTDRKLRVCRLILPSKGGISCQSKNTLGHSVGLLSKVSEDLRNVPCLSSFFLSSFQEVSRCCVMMARLYYTAVFSSYETTPGFQTLTLLHLSLVARQHSALTSSSEPYYRLIW